MMFGTYTGCLRHFNSTSMDSPHDYILINIKDQLKDYIDKCLTAQEQEAPEPEPEK